MRLRARWSGAGGERRHLDTIEEAPAFRRRLALEVERASRLSRPFAVIAFGRGGAVARSELSRLAEPMRERLRATDAVGWLGAHELGLLLRFTTSADAVALAEKICAALDAGGAPRLHCTVFAFPPAALQSAIGTETSEAASAEPAQ